MIGLKKRRQPYLGTTVRSGRNGIIIGTLGMYSVPLQVSPDSGSSINDIFVEEIYGKGADLLFTFPV